MHGACASLAQPAGREKTHLVLLFASERKRRREKRGTVVEGRGGREKVDCPALLLYLMGRGENSSSTRRGVLDLRVSTPANVSNASSEGDPTSCQEPVRTRDALDQLGPAFSLSVAQKFQSTERAKCKQAGGSWAVHTTPLGQYKFTPPSLLNPPACRFLAESSSLSPTIGV